MSAKLHSEPMTPAAAQSVLLEILRDITRLCDAHEVEYCLIGGACLGIVRHEGQFVPWDDDIDISVRSEDMPRFDKAMADLPPHLVFEASARLDSGRRIFDGRTRVTEAGRMTDRGLAIDVAPMRNWRSVWHKRIENGVSRVALAGIMPDSSVAWKGRAKRLLRQSGLYRPLKTLADLVIYPWLRAEDRALYARGTGIVSGSIGMAWKGRYPHEVVFPLRDAVFCGVKVAVPNQLERFLEIRYGLDFMELPPENKRWRHFEAAYWTGDERP
ncbi:lipopolysaccharide cholinephosphotransferase [Devosia enhydra]|uniref:Lipopolysaccharide cholinephosphotransferase n=1 Tax=Devosia enhydra TaxID=665118 RepID=A0A1K2I1L5_9HYPH|nr:LicD family protein [Devosia enhydra]SFZ86217.1 lipopolysaccharide cholinephosphotransferase [Devosia enhydra]